MAHHTHNASPAQLDQATHPFRRHIPTIVSYVAIIALCLGVQLWGVVKWPTNFDSDEATLALMARHALHGSFSVYMYGQNYLGSLETLIAASLMGLFGSTVIVFRMSALLLLGTFLVLHGLLVARFWGHTIALWSLLLLAIPGRLIYIWLYRPITGLHIIFVLGTALLLITTLQWQKKGFVRYVPAAAAGLITGIGIWSHPLFVVYLAVFGCVVVFRLREWKALREHVNTFFRNSTIVSLGTMLVAISFILTAVVAFFTSGCDPRTFLHANQTTARILVVAFVLILASSILSISRRKIEILANVLLFGIAAVIGNTPQWFNLLVNRGSTEGVITPSCPTEAVSRLNLVSGELIPALWGIPNIRNLTAFPWPHSFLWIAVTAIVCIALIAFTWFSRSSWRSLFTLSHLTTSDQGFVIVNLLLLLPIVLVILGGNTTDALSSRYLLIAWTVTTIPLAFLIRHVVKQKLIATVCLCLWVGYIGGTNMSYQNQVWSRAEATFAPREYQSLQLFLQNNQIRGGYTDYWSTYPINFLTEEHVILAPFNGVDRIKRDTREIENMKNYAYIFRDKPLNEPNPDIHLLREKLSTHDSGLSIFSGAYPEPDTDEVVERRVVGQWDVWIVRSSQ